MVTETYTPGGQLGQPSTFCPAWRVVEPEPLQALIDAGQDVRPRRLSPCAAGRNAPAPSPQTWPSQGAA